MHHLLSMLSCGELDLKPYIVTPECTLYPKYTCSKSDDLKTVILISTDNCNFCDRLYFTVETDSIICKRIFENTSDEIFRLCELGITLSGITFGKEPRDDYFYHNENPRIYEIMAIPIDYNRTAKDAKDGNFDIQAGCRWADPGVICDRIGASPYQPFPAILLSNYQTSQGLVHGSLSQRVFYHNYLAKHTGKTITLEILSSCRSIDYLELECGRVLTDEWYLGSCDHAEDLESIFTGYTDALRKKLPVNYGATAINRDNLIWGTWNDGICRNISEEMILTEAKYLKAHFPTVSWIQIDDGYAKDSFPCHAHGLGMPYEGEAGVDEGKFPNGLRAVSDKIRQIGLRPALWIGNACHENNKLYKEHPEWFVDYSSRNSSECVLDVSIPEVRQYMTDALCTLCDHYGFDAIKQDFWSYAFEERHPLLKNRDKTGYEYRTWWFHELRKHLSSDGYIQTGCDIAMGNPFLGEYATNYRYGIDIASGNWDNIKTNYLWGAACFATHTGDLFVPNSDAVGIFPKLSDTEMMFSLNYCLVTHSMVEIAGRLSQYHDQGERLKKLKKAVCNPNNGQDVYFAGYDYRTKKYAVPSIMYFKTPHFSKEEGNLALPLRTVGIFNIEETTAQLSFSLQSLGLPEGCYTLTDVWTGAQFFNVQDTFSVDIPAHGSKLFAVSRCEGPQLFDSNIRINRICVQADTMLLETDYAEDESELFFDRPVRSLDFCGKQIAFSASGNLIRTSIPGKGCLTVHF